MFAKPLKAFLFIFLFYFLISNMLVIIGNFYQSALEVRTDYYALLKRLQSFYENKISFLDYIFSKHVDHNHAFVYFLTYFDYEFFGGNFYLNKIFTFISNILSAMLLSYIVMKSNLKINYKFLLYIAITISIFSLSSYETWLYPFQVVLTSFRFFLLLSIFLFVVGIQKNDNYFLISSFLVGLLTHVSHGSGITLIPLLLFFSIIFRSRKSIFIGLLSTIFVVFFESVYQSNSLLKLNNVIESLLNFKDLIYYNMDVLGYFVVYDNYFLLFFALLSVIYFLILSVYFLFFRKDTSSIATNFFIIYGIFSLIGIFLSVLLNMSWYEPRGYNSEEIIESYEFHFYASRYSITAYGFWLSFFVLGAIHISKIKNGNCKILFKNFLIFLCITFILFNILRSFYERSIFTPHSINLIQKEKLIINDKHHKLLDANDKRMLLNHYLYKNKKGLYADNYYLKHNIYILIDDLRTSSKIKFVDEYITKSAINIFKLKDELINQIKYIYLKKPNFIKIVDFSNDDWDKGILKNNNKCFLIKNKIDSTFFNIAEELIFKSGNKLIQSIEENKICVDKHLNPSLDAQPSEIIVTNKIYPAIYIENINDKNWINGISKFRKNTLCSSTQLKLSIGDKLEFTSGTRTIINIKKNNDYKHITVDGNELKPSIDGGTMVKLLKKMVEAEKK